MLKSRFCAPNKKYNYYLSLGSNISPRTRYMTTALAELAQIGSVVKKSSLYESEPWGKKNQPLFLNAIILFQTDLSPFILLQNIKQIEKKIGRTQTGRWGPRNIDIDIIFCSNLSIKNKELNIPHLRYKDRKFVLIPMMELDKSYRVDGISATIETVLKNCSDRSYIQAINTSW
jgi:2-amino-4-hydroxy-6-hydroxymethyldihydropteridine diphosphokinase